MDFLFGRSMNALQPKIPAECTAFLQAFTEAQRWVGKRREAGWLQRLRYNFDKGWRSSCAKVHGLIDQQVERALRETEKEEKAYTSSPPVRKRYVYLTKWLNRLEIPLN